MKRVFVAAGALLLGTSALAYAGSMDKTTMKPVDTSADAKLTSAVPADTSMTGDPVYSDWDKARLTSWQKTLAPSKDDMSTTDGVKLASFDDQTFASDDGGAKLIMASAETGWTDTVDKPVVEDATSYDDTAWTDSADKSFAAIPGDDAAWMEAANAKLAMAPEDDLTDTELNTASVDKAAYTGMGGPLEETATTPTVVQPSNANPELDARGIPVISDVAYVPPGYNGTVGGAMGGPEEAAAESYPPCTAQRTDNCTQTYERGVREQVASSGQTGSEFAATDTTAAMGGPYEPVDDAGADLAMNGDGTIDTSAGETSDTLDQTAMADTSTVADHSEYQGVGGPIEAQSGYPPCSPGPGDDRCIQLYEPGVTGAGN